MALLSRRITWVHPWCWFHTACVGISRASWSYRSPWRVIAVNWTIVDGLAGSFGDFGWRESFGNFLYWLVLLLKFFRGILWLLAVETLSNFLVLLFDFFVLIFACVIFAAHVIFHSVLGLFFVKGYASNTCESVVIGAASERDFIVFKVWITRIQVRQSTRFNVGSVRFGPFSTE